MLFSVVICTHNRCKVLAEALQAQAQVRAPYGTERELVVVDNASKDNTRTVVAEFSRVAPYEVRYVHEERLGHSFALNTGTANARGEIIAFTDDDAFPGPGWLEALHFAFNEQQADWAFGPVTPAWESTKPTWFGSEVFAYFAGLDYGSDLFVVKDSHHPFIGVNHACRREVLLRLGGYREDLGGFGTQGGVGNDEDLFRRALGAGVKIVYTPEAGVTHLIPPRRCTKAYHRRGMWTGTAAYFRYLITDPPPPPTILGLPRYFYRKMIDHSLLWAKETVRGNRSGAFYHELQALRFGMLICRAFRYCCRPRLAQGSDQNGAAASPVNRT